MLLDELRVVILSEAGSGKTEEIQHTNRQLRKHGKAAFFMRLEHVAHDFDWAFVEGDLAKFEYWMASPEPGWLLVDSVDESRVRWAQDFDRAIRKLAARIPKAKQRTHLLITGGRLLGTRNPSWISAIACSRWPTRSRQAVRTPRAVNTPKRAKPDKSHFKIVTLQDLPPAQMEIFAGAKGISDQ